MPLFFFHLRSPAGCDEDEIGVELDGIESAYLEAYRTVPALSAEMALAGAIPHRHTFEIVDQSGNLLMEVPFSEVLDRGRGPTAPALTASFRRAVTTMQRTAELIISIREERTALRATLAETKRLLALARQACSPR